jgi:ABC-type nitrate/sulfonate/bicarbonate transport system substrate-binding protein
MLLKYWNLDPDKDVRILQVAGPTRIPAMMNGQIDGTLVGTNDVPQILESGCCRVLVDMLELPLEYARFGQVVPTQLLKTRREVFVKLCRRPGRRNLCIQNQPRVGALGSQARRDQEPAVWL